MKKSNLKRSMTFCALMLSVTALQSQLSGNFTSCDPNPYAWHIGGDMLAPTAPINPPPHWTMPPMDIGTCNNYPFILKANNLSAIFLSTTAKVGIGLGHNNPLATLDVKDQSSFRVYGDSPGNIESSTHMNMTVAYGKNFYFNEGTAQTNSNRVCIQGGGNVGIGITAPLEKLHLQNGNLRLDAGNININSGNINLNGTAFINSAAGSNQALSVSQTSGITFLTYGDGATHITSNLQIGFTSSSIQTPLSRLNLSCPSTSPNMEGLRITTATGNGARMINVDNTSTQITQQSPTSSVFGVYGNGRTVIGYEFPSAFNHLYMLAVNGMIGARAIKVSIQNPWPDYVFKNDYNLQSLESLEFFIHKNQHLPNIPSASDLNSDACGLDLAEMQGKQMEKIEEIYLHLIELNKQIKELKHENLELKKQLKNR